MVPARCRRSQRHLLSPGGSAGCCNLSPAPLVEIAEGQLLDPEPQSTWSRSRRTRLLSRLKKEGPVMRKKWMIAGSVAVILAGSLVVARATTRSQPEDRESPFRLGKVQAEDLQVSVREVGVVDPEIKV